MPIHIADRQLAHFFLAAVDQVDQSARDHYGAEYRGDNTQAMHHRKAAHRTRSPDQQRQAGNQCGDIRIDDGIERALITGLYRHLRRHAITQFLADTFIDQHIGINRHTQRQGNGSNAGQGHGCLQHGQQCHQKKQVSRER